eukprot:TRINITY_DN2583_c0_g1_i1.p1 TRINITY_DN2583_c0_g1~~TRINITY_DN2583_c0_g1_i1.p1  ORF type:complete len:1196 (-),score=284.05 TRINITY_DN2583_c0_g1_i1:115-3702(-)
MAGEGEAQLAVVGAKGLPDVGCVLSLKLGNSRRQGPYPCKETFKLSTWPCAMQIDVLRLIGRSPSATSGLLKEYALASAANGTTADDVDDFTCRVPLQSADGRAMSLTLKVCKPQAGAAAEAKTDALDLQDPSRLLEEKEFCWGYLESNGLKEFLQECFEHLMVERPPDPYGYLASRLQAAAEAEQRGEAPSPPKATASSPPAVPSRRPVPRPPSPQGEGPVKAAAPRRISFADEEAEDGDDDVFKKSCAPAAAASPIHALGGLASDTPTASGFARSAALRRRAAATLAQAGRNGTLGEALRRVPQLHTLPRPEGASVPASASSRRGNGAEAPSGERLRARARATLLAGSRDGQLGKALVKLARNPALGKVHTLVGCEDPASTPDGIVPERARELKQRARLALQEGQHAGALGDTLQRIPQLPVLSVGTSGYDGGSAKSAVAAAAALRLRARAAKTLLEGWRQGQLTDALQRTPQLVTLPKPENSGDAHSFAEGGKAARRPASRVPPGRAWNLRARACKALREANTSGRLVEALSRTPQLHTLQAAGPEGSCGAQAVSLLGRARRTLLRASRSGALASALETAQAPPLPPGVAQSAAAEWQRRREAEVPSGELPVSGDAAVAFAAAEQASQAEASWTPSLGPAAPPSPAMAPMEEHTPHVAPEPWIPMVQSQQDPPWVEPPAYVAPESDGPFGPPAAEPAPWPTQAAAPTLAEAASESCAFPSSEVLPEREERIERLLGEIAALRAESSLGSPISSTPGPQDADVWRVERLCAEVQSLRNASDPNAQRVERLHAEVRNLRAAAAQDANLARAERLGAEVRTLRAASIQDPEAMRIARLEAEIQSLRAGAQDRTVAPMGGNAARAEYLLAELDATRRNVEAAQLQRLMQEVRGLQAQRSHAAGFIGSAAGGRAAEAAVRAERLLQELAALRRHGGMAGPAAQAQFAARRQHLLSELAALRAAASVPAGVPAGGPAQASSRYEPELAGNDVGELLEFLPEPSRPSAMSAGAVAAADDFGSEAFGFGGGPLQPPERRSGASAAPGAEAFGFGYQGPSAGFDDGTPRLSHLMPEPPLDPELSHFVPEFARASNMMPDLAHLIPEDAHLGQFMPEAQSNLAEFVPFTRSAPGSVDPDLMAFLPMIDPVAAAHNARNHGAGSLYPRQKAPPPHLLLLGAAAAGPVGGGGPYIEEVFTPRRN